MGSLCNYGGLSKVEGDVNKIVKKSDKFKYKKQNNNFARASRFIVHFLPSLHDYDLKVPNFMFGGVSEHKMATFFFFSCTSIHSLWFQLQKGLITLDELNEVEY